MSIYDNKSPFFYIIQDKRNDMYYAGSRYSRSADISTFMTENGYKTTSKTVNEIIHMHGIETFIIRKIRTFTCPEDAYSYEKRFLKRVDARNNSRFYNGHNNDFMFNTNKDYAVVRNTETNSIFRIPVTDDIIKNENIVGHTKYRKKGILVGATEIKLYSVTDTRWKTGELISPDIGKSHYIDSHGVHHYTSRDNAADKGMTPFRKNKVTARDSEGNTLTVDKTDIRLKTGEIFGVTKGQILVKDKEGNAFLVYPDDERYLRKEVEAINSGKVAAIDKLGNRFQTHKDDPRFQSGEIFGVTKGMKLYNNGKINRYFHDWESIPADFVKGKLK